MADVLADRLTVLGHMYSPSRGPSRVPSRASMASDAPSRSSSRAPSRAASRSAASRNHSIPARTPCIDHKMFPHIMDAVLAGVSPEGSLALRSASREMRDRVDNELWRHLLLGPSDAGRGIAVAAAGGGMPLRIRHCGHTSHVVDCGSPCSVVPERNEIFPGLLQRARVVSIRGPVDEYGGSLAWFSGKLGQVETLRILPPMPRPFTIWPDTVRGVRTVIIFTVMTRGSQRYFEAIPAVGGHAPPMLYKPPFAPIPPVTSSATRLVLNVAFHPDDPFTGDCRIGPVHLSPRMTELVIIFAPVPPPDVVPALGKADVEVRRPPLGILHQIVTGMLSNRKIKVTVVDAQRLGCPAFGLPPDFEGDMCEELLGIAAEIFLTQGVGFEPDTTKYIEFLTLEQYAAVVDDDDFALETKE